jgi:hypothetical protein
MFKRNLALTRKRLLYQVLHEDDENWPPPDTHVIELPRNDPELLEANLQLAAKIARDMLAGLDELRPIVLMPELEWEIPAEYAEAEPPQWEMIADEAEQEPVTG